MPLRAGFPNDISAFMDAIFINNDEARIFDEIAHVHAYIVPVSQCHQDVTTGMTVTGIYIRLYMSKGEAAHFFWIQDA
jgi:hypothetical protein